MNEDNKITKIVLMDIDVPRRIEKNVRGANKNLHLVPEEEKDDYHENFQTAFREYLKGHLPFDSVYEGVMVRIRVGSSEPVWVVMNRKGPPNYVNVTGKIKISNLRGLELP
ncbi:MAG: hypothetical protein GTN36_04980 [Candidatus Aenigmarchaeota archaeon]|nr:hypothetical protein [Candidatus Aenigmarchaeota archaeon]